MRLRTFRRIRAVLFVVWLGSWIGLAAAVVTRNPGAPWAWGIVAAIALVVVTSLGRWWAT